MSTAPLAFTGISTYSNGLQTIGTRAVAIASVPLKRLQGQESDLLQKKQLLGSLNDTVAALASSLTTLGETAKNQALAASSSNPALVSVTDSDPGATRFTTATDQRERTSRKLHSLR